MTSVEVLLQFAAIGCSSVFVCLFVTSFVFGSIQVFGLESDCTGSRLVVGLVGHSCWLVAGVDSIVFASIRWCV